MAFYAVDVRDRVIQRVTEEYTGMDNKRIFLIEAGSANQAWAKAGRAMERVGSAVCSSCRHHYCRVCEECSVSKRHSDYWICHCCGALIARLPNLDLREVFNGLGKN